MDILIYVGDVVQSTIILGIIIYGTKLINYYYNFYHIYNYLDYEQKLGYFKSNNLVNLISKYIFVKKIIVYYFLIPVIKLNYLFISIFITLLYSLCYSEFKKILTEQQRKKYKNKKNKKKTYDLILSESSNDIDNINKNINHSNISNYPDNITNKEILNNNSQTNSNLSGEDNNSQIDSELGKNVIREKKNFKNEICNVDKIGIDYDNGILGIIEFMADTNIQDIDTNINKNLNLETKINDEDKNNVKPIDNNDIELVDKNDIPNNNHNLNLLNEIDLLKVNKSLNYGNYLNDDNNLNNDNNPNNDDNLNDYITDNAIINSNYNKNNINVVNDNDINEYLIIDNKIKNLSKTSEKTNAIKNVNPLFLENEEYNETINFDDIDFGTKVENINVCKTINKIDNLENIANANKKKIIKIGKKKNK